MEDGGGKTWRYALAEGLQTSMATLVKSGNESADGLSWSFQNVGLSPGYEASSSSSPSSFAFNLLQQLEKRQGSKSSRSKKKVRGRKTADPAHLGAAFLAFDEIQSRSVGSSIPILKEAVLSCKTRHAHDPDSEVSGLLPKTSEPTCGPQSFSDLSCTLPLSRQASEPSGHGWIEKAALASAQAKVMMKEISILERAQIGAGAGGIAGVITYTCLHPLDTIKTKLQTRGASNLYSGPLDVVVKTFKNQGILGFYSGISAVLVGSMFSSGVYFGTCELGKALLMQVPSFPAFVVPPIAGAFGNIASSAILVPKELITQRMQAGAKGRSWEVFAKIIEKEGLKGLYTGYSAALVRNLPASVLSFSSFEYLKSAWVKRSGKSHLDPWQSVLSGALAGVISSALTTPLDVVKTRLMTQARAKVSHASLTNSMATAELQAKIAASTYKGITSTLRKIWLEEGWMGLTKGLVPRILYSACFSALGYFAFETARLALVKQHLEKKKQAAKAMMRKISILKRAQIGVSAGGIAGVIKYTCLYPMDTIKTKLQTGGASNLYSGPLDIVVKTFNNQGMLGFYSSISAILVGSIFSWGVYFGTCELGKALLMQVPSFLAVVVPPIAVAFGNIASAISVPKELITQRMQAGLKRSWKVFVKIIEKGGLKGLYTDTLQRLFGTFLQVYQAFLRLNT
ncbi:hypothetical protein GOP47_0017862 [Adiantum capillus-veneris]|uniref:Mitochondrial substrate carrier family protein n=1 Tax=Adiantum capillus-veneris TaxID=13818 RepID=A0A9D4UH58_ADICA|nr:hypothetical protein GOP47_0017862 [Adiantum capillus-veneris]